MLETDRFYLTLAIQEAEQAAVAYIARIVWAANDEVGGALHG